MENEDEILKGNFPFALTDKCAYVAQMKDIITISISNVYESREVVEKEIVGYKVLHTLLDKFIAATNNKFQGNATHYDEMILKLLRSEEHTSELQSRPHLVCRLLL